MFRRGEAECVRCANGRRRVPSGPPVLGVEVPLHGSRVLCISVVEGRVVFTVGEPMLSEVRSYDPIQRTTHVTSRSRVLRVLSHLSVPAARLEEVQAALRKVVRDAG